jgi:hypothetical protein
MAARTPTRSIRAQADPVVRLSLTTPDNESPHSGARHAPNNGFTDCAGAAGSRTAPVRRVPDNGQLAATTADPTAHAQAHEFARALARRDQRGQIQKHVPAARPAEDAQSIAVFVKRAEGIELDDHPRR